MVATNAFGMGIDKTDIRFARRSRQLLPGVGRRGPRWRAGRLHPAFSPGARNKVHTAVALMRQLGSCARAPRVVSQSCVRVSRQKRFAPCSTHTATGANWIRPRSRAWCSTRRRPVSMAGPVGAPAGPSSDCALHDLRQLPTHRPSHRAGEGSRGATAARRAHDAEIPTGGDGASPEIRCRSGHRRRRTRGRHRKFADGSKRSFHPDFVRPVRSTAKSPKTLEGAG